MKASIQARISQARLAASRAAAPPSAAPPNRRQAASKRRSACTGLPCVHPDSDVDLDRIVADLVAQYQPADWLERFAVKCLARELGNRVRMTRAAAAIRMAIRTQPAALHRAADLDAATHSENLRALRRVLQFISGYQRQLSNSRRWLMFNLGNIHSRQDAQP